MIIIIYFWTQKKLFFNLFQNVVRRIVDVQIHS